MRKQVTVIVALLVLLAGMAAFAAGVTGSQIVGKWAQVNGPDKVEFAANGTFSGVIAYEGSPIPQPQTGTYMADNDKVSITTQGILGTTMVWRVKPAADGSLVVTYENGGSAKQDGAMAKFARLNK